ncbi:alpha-2,8-sialyltransferase 8E isoform X1 [Carassius gibelio]|uniref:alpha-2,8-sialyltransferase 8E isoform X1 n=2 Tax=Carassius gibelio TaxID=101364 RepID=UPI0022792587|nr:alpha-2,8-sialyltransferase 8E isoform X1 [Carassius gibelio]
MPDVCTTAQSLQMDLFKWIFGLLTVLVIFTCLYLPCSRNHKMGSAMTDRLKLLNCMKLRQKFFNISPAKSIDMTNVTGPLSAFMSCPHVSNRTQKELNRLRLRFCCNATDLLYLTKKNTAVNQSIPYETSKRVYKVGAALHKMLPEDFPWSSRGHLGRCAVVGNGGILKNSSCGREIDSADFVIRLNLAPINDSDVGVKTDLVTINPSQLSAKNMAVNPDPLVQRVSVYGNASLMISAFSYTDCTAVSVKTLQVLQPIRPQQPVVFFSPYYLKTLDCFWKGLGLKVKRLSTGFMLVNVALELCDDVHLFGFWPFDINLKKQTLQHHYYDNKPPKPFVHAMPDEFVHLLQLHSQGALTLHLQPCL